jgi:hypothetical protein
LSPCFSASERHSGYIAGFDVAGWRLAELARAIGSIGMLLAIVPSEAWKTKQEKRRESYKGERGYY